MKLKLTERAVFLAIVWIMLLFFSLSFLNALVSMFESNPESQAIASLSWAGYIISQSFNPDFAVSAIESSWIVPKINTSAANGYSSAWIGIGGQLDRTLIQVGTEHDLIGGQESYHAWYEMLPDYSVKIKEVTIKPGDTIYASLALADPAKNKWSIHLIDITNGQSFSISVHYNSTRSSGEWIMERPTVNGEIAPLSDFGTVQFTNSSAYANNVKGVIGNFTYSRVEMMNQLTKPLTATSPLPFEGSSFTVGFLEEN